MTPRSWEIPGAGFFFFREFGLPLGEYADFADCVAKNQDKDNPEAYCGALKAQMEKSGTIELTREEVRKLCPSCADRMDKLNITVLKVPPPENQVSGRDQEWLRFLLASPIPKQSFTIAKLDEAQNLVFGWASVSIKSDELLTDRQGDQIAPDELEKAAYDFVEHSRIANEMHRGGPVGVLVESLVVTPEKLEAMGLLRKSAPKAGLWVGFRVRPDVFQKVKTGELSMFSIEGKALKVAA